MSDGSVQIPSMTSPYLWKASLKLVSSVLYERPTAAAKLRECNTMPWKWVRTSMQRKNECTSNEEFRGWHASYCLVDGWVGNRKLRVDLLAYSLSKYVPNFTKESHLWNLIKVRKQNQVAILILNAYGEVQVIHAYLNYTSHIKEESLHLTQLFSTFFL